MAITNAQQYQQLVNKPADGKRPGYRGDDANKAREARSREAKSSSKSSSKSSNTNTGGGGGNTNRESYITNYSSKGIVKGGGKKVGVDKDGSPIFEDSTPSKEVRDRQKTNYQDQFTSKGIVPPGPNRKSRQKALNYTNKQLARYLSRFGSYYDPNKFSVTKTGYPNFGFPNIYEAIDEELEAGKELKDILKTGNMIPIGKSGTSFEMSAVPDLDIDSIRELAATQTLAQGAPLTGYQAGALKDLKTSIGKRDVLLDTGDTSDIYPDPPEATNTGPDDPVDPCLGPNPPAYCFAKTPVTPDPVDPRTNFYGLSPRIAGSMFDFSGFADGGRAGLAEGGMPYEGGIMDLESGRQMYFLGKLVKKVTRSVKKIAKSPIGKAAIGAALFKFGGGGGLGKFFGKGSLNPFLRKVAGDTAFSGLGSILSKAGLVSKAGLPTFTGGLALSSILPFLGKQEEDGFDLEQYYKTGETSGDVAPYNRIAGSEFDFYGSPKKDGGLMRAGYQEGGDAEPVAKKTMPLLDMDGKEKDYRETGGFVDMGRMEKADDVPARLSKNEFVFTADAVRNAGEGDIDKGAEVMYNMMKNLESGGEVSEESQGLDGAREMFQTSQRLGEVI